MRRSLILAVSAVLADRERDAARHAAETLAFA